MPGDPNQNAVHDVSAPTDISSAAGNLTGGEPRERPRRDEWRSDEPVEGSDPAANAQQDAHTAEAEDKAYAEAADLGHEVRREGASRDAVNSSDGD